MSRPIARHADNSYCYTVDCKLGRHIALDQERDVFVQEGLKSQGLLPDVDIKQRREARKQAEFKQEWKERARGWKELGFQYPVSVRKADDWVRYAVAGKTELDHLSERQRKALRFFTTNNYRWINGHLYNHGEALPSGERASFEEHDFKKEHRGSIIADPTVEQVEELLPVLDEALMAKTAEARVVYRGVSRETLYGLVGSSMNDEQFHEYVDENFKLGSEVEMPGYLSASPSPKAALSYTTSQNVGTGAKREGIFFELLTRSGVNVSGISSYAREAETLLPRNTRWKVAAVHKSKELRTAENPLSAASAYRAKPITNVVTLIQLVEIEA